MSERWRVLITGPTRGLDEWAGAARDAGWEPELWPLLEVLPSAAPLRPARLPDWIAVTSGNVLAALEEAAAHDARLKKVPLAVVGEASAERLFQAGWTPELVPRPGAAHARGLAELIIAETRQGAHVLWPRGARATELGQLLERSGRTVEAPIVYDVRALRHAGAPPHADVVFFASPSAVRAWLASRPAWIPAAIAMGWTTFDALLAAEHAFSTTLPLASPDPAALGVCLSSFVPSE